MKRTDGNNETPESIGGANLSHVNLRRADLRGADLRDANFRFVDLSGAHLEGADLIGANLDGSNLTRATYDEDTRWPAGFDPRRAGALLMSRAPAPPLPPVDTDKTQTDERFMVRSRRTHGRPVRGFSPGSFVAGMVAALLALAFLVSVVGAACQIEHNGQPFGWTFRMMWIPGGPKR